MSPGAAVTCVSAEPFPERAAVTKHNVRRWGGGLQTHLCYLAAPVLIGSSPVTDEYRCRRAATARIFMVTFPSAASPSEQSEHNKNNKKKGGGGSSPHLSD